MNSNVRTAHQIRKAYVDFFLERGHTRVPGAPLVPKGDPTLLFTSAGMVQFKDFYLQPDNLPYTRAVSVQKCLRAGDLESVGKTLRHHTFFEMLGNFSFGDYFKKEAISWAWEFVTEILRIPEERLYISIYEDDDEAFALWNKDAGVPAAKIVRLGKKDNFWGPVGKTGVCGPCSEIYYDAGEEKGCGSDDCAPGCECDRYLEFWNLVFPQFFLEEDGNLRPLEKPGIDTGAGLERIAMIMQGVEDNFHTDLFAPITRAVVERLPEGSVACPEDMMDINMIADHARALTFTIAEGIYPANEGRGYLLRRILRRALTRLHLFGVNEPFLNGLVGDIISVMRDDYPDLQQHCGDIEKIVRSEEESFFRTLEDGRGRFSSIVLEVSSEGSRVIDGQRAFLLYDTYGFPLELTVALAAREGMTVDEEGFSAAMNEQRKRAQKSSSFSSGESVIVTMTNVSEGETSVFTGYEKTEEEAAVRSFREIEKKERADITWSDISGKGWEIVFDRTPFYATSGGQMADRGTVGIAGHTLEVMDVFKRGGEIIHLVESPRKGFDLAKDLEKGHGARLMIDLSWRKATEGNHTTTHLLHAALKKIVGTHVAQAGSSVDGERLRFDFSHYRPLTSEEKRSVEKTVNRWISEAHQVRTEIMSYQEALKSDVVALFDEKYGDTVRVVRTGDISAELCGGTHIDNTGRIGLFLILSESSVAAGVRRIEGVTGEAAIRYMHEVFDRDESVAGLLKVSPSDMMARVSSILSEIDEMKREIKKLQSGETGGEMEKIIQSAAVVEGIRIASGRINVRESGDLRNQADIFRSRVASGVGVFSCPQKGKMQFVITVTDDLLKKGIEAGLLVQALGEIAGGGGGGKKHLAQLGTKEMESEKKVFEALPGVVKKLLSD
ncbi:MAG: alanine--tRNA ligase [Candidatus Krumholzibacteriota bacterium]|nr:alanine--tRNA ligase [Candidatus Krumholzibacteriota bacterium]